MTFAKKKNKNYIAAPDNFPKANWLNLDLTRTHSVSHHPPPQLLQEPTINIHTTNIYVTIIYEYNVKSDYNILSVIKLIPIIPEVLTLR
jgi:hypothetical protein